MVQFLNEKNSPPRLFTLGTIRHFLPHFSLLAAIFSSGVMASDYPEARQRENLPPPPTNEFKADPDERIFSAFAQFFRSLETMAIFYVSIERISFALGNLALSPSYQADCDRKSHPMVKTIVAKSITENAPCEKFIGFAILGPLQQNSSGAMSTARNIGSQNFRRPIGSRNSAANWNDIIACSALITVRHFDLPGTYEDINEDIGTEILACGDRNYIPEYITENWNSYVPLQLPISFDGIGLQQQLKSELSFYTLDKLIFTYDFETLCPILRLLGEFPYSQDHEEESKQGHMDRTFCHPKQETIGSKQKNGTPRIHP